MATISSSEVESRTTSLFDHATALWTRSQQTGEMDDLDQSIECYQEALKLQPEEHPFRVMSLFNLVVGLRTRFEHTGDRGDLDQSIEYDQEVLKLRPKRHLFRATSLSKLAVSLRTRFELLGDGRDLDRSIEYDEEALNLRPEGHPFRTTLLSSLSLGLRMRFQKTGDRRDLDRGMGYLQDTLQPKPKGDRLGWGDTAHEGVSVDDRLSDSFQWVETVPPIEDPSAMEADITSISPSDCHSTFARSSTAAQHSCLTGHFPSVPLADDAASCAPDVEVVDNEISDQFKVMSVSLETPIASGEGQPILPQTGEDTTRYQPAAVERVQRASWLSSILRNKSLQDTHPTPSRGTVIIFSIGQYCSDDQPTRPPLVVLFPDDPLHRARSLSKRLDDIAGNLCEAPRDVADILRDIWRVVVGPITIQLERPPSSPNLPYSHQDVSHASAQILAIRPAANENTGRGTTTTCALCGKVSESLGGAGRSEQLVEKPTIIVSNIGQAKRKREAPGDVTNDSTGIGAVLGGGEGGGRADQYATGLKSSLSEKDVHGMQVDPTPIQAPSCISAQEISTTPTITKVAIDSSATAMASWCNALTASISFVTPHISNRLPMHQDCQAKPVRDEDGAPVHKKQRTSSISSEWDLLDLQDAKEGLVDVADANLVLQVPALPHDDGDIVLEDVGPAEGEVRWDDLDKEDAGDLLMISEYVGEIYEYLLKLELATMPNPNYMDTQADLSWKMRGILADWLIQLHSRFRLIPETLFLATNIIDRFLSCRAVSVNKLQLVGTTALFIAAKYEEIMAPSATHFLACVEGNYTKAEVVEAEKYMLRILDYNMSYPNPIHFLRRASKADDYDVAVRTLAKYLIEISCFEHRLLGVKPSQLAASGMWLSRLALDKGEWNPNLVHYSGYTENALIPVAQHMLNYVLKPTLHDSFFKKYASRKFLKASPFMHSWATDRWPEGTTVNLEQELPELRRAIQERRDAGKVVELEQK
ncbi:G2/mitotic-specific cyclin [Tulasnella sp. JGI-2019a]|nr:G2/mitotic-specific cyclin [Tulasnella sp. JGI-2019a]